MKKLIFTLYLFSSSLFATDFDHYLTFGLNDGYSSQYGFEFSPSIGYQIINQDTHRWSMTASYGTESHTTTFVGAYDYIYHINTKWAILGGLSTGYAVYEKSSNHMLAGAKVGGLYSLTNKATMELGYLIQDTIDNWKDNKDISWIDSIYMNINYKF